MAQAHPRPPAPQLEAVIERWRATFDSIPDPIVLVDRAFTVRRANAAAAGDQAVREALGEPCHRLLFGLDTPCAGCPVTELGATGRQDADGDVVVPGDGRTWSVHVAPLQPRGDEDGAGDWLVCQHRDVTDARRLQREVAMLEKLAAIGQLASSVAHELNNPLTAILSFAQLLQRDAVDPEARAELIGDIEAQAQRCRRIVRSLLDFGRPASDSGVVTLDFGSLVRECLHVFTSQYAARDALGFTLIGDDAPDLPAVSGVPDALRSLVINLVQNAVLAMDKVGHVTVQLDAVDNAHAVRLWVTDTGPGVPLDLRDKIFQPFYTTRVIGLGTGLGLSIAHNVVRDHGGRIEVTDGPGGGARFIVHLPAAHAAQTTDAP